MRRARRLNHNDYVVYIGQRINQLLTLSKSNIVLERTWYTLGDNSYEIEAHVKFNADTMNGIEILARLALNGKLCSSRITDIKLFKVSELGWLESLVGSFAPTEIENGVFTQTITQIQISPYELSGKETYSIEVTAQRKRKTFTKKLWFNHLGCFDSIWRLKAETSYINLTKLDE